MKGFPSNRRFAVALSFILLGISLLALGAIPTGIWSIVTTPSAGTPNQFLLRVRCTSASSCWAVGFQGAFGSQGIDQTLIQHWNGTAWSIVASPNTSALNTNWLSDVACSGETDCWAVGYSYVAGTGLSPLVERWNGNSWMIWPLSVPDNSVRLMGITCLSTSNCWAVGTATAGILVVHWNGNSWDIVDSPSVPGGVLAAVNCASASDCSAVGRISQPNLTHTLAVHWDGKAWSTVPSPNGSDDSFLTDVSCPSASECWAVGYYNPYEHTRTIIERWNGATWEMVASPNRDPADPSDYSNNYLESIACLSAHDCWAVGDTSATLIQHWDGNAWAIVNSPNAAGYNLVYGIACTSSANCWAVGALGSGSNYVPLALHYLGPPPVSAAVSRKVHGGAGVFDIDLLNLPTIESRGPGATGSDGVDYKVVFTFVKNVTTCGTVNIGSTTLGPDSNQCTVNLTGVANGQSLALTLNAVSDSDNNTGDLVLSLPILLGDTNGDGGVNSADISQIKSQSGSEVTSASFRNDLNGDGIINSADIGLAKSKSGTGLP